MTYKQFLDCLVIDKLSALESPRDTVVHTYKLGNVILFQSLDRRNKGLTYVIPFNPKIPPINGPTKLTIFYGNFTKSAFLGLILASRIEALSYAYDTIKVLKVELFMK